MSAGIKTVCIKRIWTLHLSSKKPTTGAGVHVDTEWWAIVSRNNNKCISSSHQQEKTMVNYFLVKLYEARISCVIHYWMCLVDLMYFIIWPTFNADLSAIILYLLWHNANLLNLSIYISRCRLLQQLLVSIHQSINATTYPILQLYIHKQSLHLCICCTQHCIHIYKCLKIDQMLHGNIRIKHLSYIYK